MARSGGRRERIVNALRSALEQKDERSRAAAHKSETPVPVHREQLVQHGRSLGVHVYNGLVVLVESDEMGERGHERLQLREAVPIRGRDP